MFITLHFQSYWIFMDAHFTVIKEAFLNYFTLSPVVWQCYKMLWFMWRLWRAGVCKEKCWTCWWYRDPFFQASRPNDWVVTQSKSQISELSSHKEKEFATDWRTKCQNFQKTSGAQSLGMSQSCWSITVDLVSAKKGGIIICIHKRPAKIC